jgi:signal transduction histidine kinase
MMPPEKSVSRLPDMPEDRLRDANEQLILKALQSQEQAEESEQRYLDQHDANELLVKKQELLRSLASQLVLTEQRERKRLAAELHDYLAQMLVLGRLRIGQAQSSLAGIDPWLGTFIDDIDDIFSKSLTYTRTLMAELNPPLLDELGLPAALQWLGGHMIKYGLHVEVKLSQFNVALPSEQCVLLYQSVRELLLNVVKHAKTQQASLSLSVEGGDNLRIVVQDAGSGFENAVQEPKSQGEHFGLFSTHERMQAMGGWLQVDSAPGRGTMVTLGLPLKQPMTAPPRVAATMPAGPHITPMERASTRQRVLLVDDHAMVRQGLRKILEDYSDLTVIGEAANGAEAVSMAAQLQPDIVLMDINMPEMDGIEATKQIKAGQPATIVIGLSVNNSLQIQEAMKQAGASSFVSKDEAAEELHDTIAAMA